MSFLELAKQALEETKQISDADYHARVEAALQAVCRPDYPAGMIPWLGEHEPGLYGELTSRLPDLIHRLWSAHAPLEEFSTVVGAWLDAHRRACELYKEHLQKHADRVLERPHEAEQ